MTVGRRIGAVVVNYNAGGHLTTCVASLREAGVDEIVVADNASTDASIQELRRADESVVVVATGGNLGYGAGANRGAAALRCEPDALLICNPDLVVEPASVKALRDALDRDRELGVVGPRIENADGSLYPSARTFPRLVDAVGHAFLGLLMPGNRFTRRYRLLDWDHESARRVDWVSGACFVIRREVFDQLSGFNEDYFMYLEDVDLCKRAWDLGVAVGYEPDARVTHVQGVSADQLPYRMLAEHHRSIWRWWWRSSRWPARALAPLVGVGLAVRFGLAVAVRTIRRKR